MKEQDNSNEMIKYLEQSLYVGGLFGCVLFFWLEELYISPFILKRKIPKTKTIFYLCSAVPLSKDAVLCFQNKKLLFSGKLYNVFENPRNP